MSTPQYQHTTHTGADHPVLPLDTYSHVIDFAVDLDEKHQPVEHICIDNLETFDCCALLKEEEESKRPRFAVRLTLHRMLATSAVLAFAISKAIRVWAGESMEPSVFDLAAFLSLIVV